MIFLLKLNKFKFLKIILTKKYLIFLNKNGILNLKINFKNIFFYNNNFYFFFNKNINKYLYNNIFMNLYYLYLNIYIYLNIKGIGYKFLIKNNYLYIRIGYSHFLKYLLPNNIIFLLKNSNSLFLYSNNKYKLKKFISIIKLYKKINYYKNSGIFYNNECILKKKKINK